MPAQRTGKPLGNFGAWVARVMVALVLTAIVASFFNLRGGWVVSLTALFTIVLWFVEQIYEQNRIEKLEALRRSEQSK